MVIKDNDGDKTTVNEDGTLSSHFFISAEEMRAKLDTISPTLCLAKWKQVSLHLPTGLTNSCYHPPLHSIDVSELENNPSALHNTRVKGSVRAAMLGKAKQDDPAVSECSYCWKMEAHGEMSDRHYRSAEPWAAEAFDAIVNDPTGKEATTPTYVEVNFNNACNLACSYCSPQFSSTWMAQVKEHGPYPTTVPHNDPSYFSGPRKVIPHNQPNPNVDAFWKWWPDLYPSLRHFRMTGGEPLLDKNTYRVFDYVLAHPKPDLHLNVTSNFSTTPELFDKYLSKVQQLCDGNNIEHFMQYVSVDSFGTQAEYIRSGLSFDTLVSNVERYLTEVPGKNSVTFIITMNNLCIPGIQDLFSYILDLRKRHSHTYQRVWFDTPVLRTPKWQSLQILPPTMLAGLEKARDFMAENIETSATQFKGFKDYELQRLNRDIKWAKESVDHVSRIKAAKDFYLFFNEYDKRNGTDFLTTFPTMSEWWAFCEKIANE